MSYENVNKVHAVGHLVDLCDKCGDRKPLFRFRSGHLCKSCLKTTKRSLAGPAETNRADKHRKWWHAVVDGAADNPHTAGTI
jgi:hypothetical protein